ncbi:DUF3574 domain-containing protein [uncultured Kordia sp.]|uniref:DUF3574 domain-containing protein n=1 Tax=uncultured Kordia sp. TaxID=507699 RepID=UPI00262A7BB5|nr:DUF3574 domain-containing protein [uncultured Kordia sp.]
MSTTIRMCIFIIISVTFFSCSTTKFTSNYIKTELYFGLLKKDGVVTEEEWKGFKADIISKKFSGYTEINSKGFWTNPKGETVSENSKLIIYLNKGTKQDSIAIAFVIGNYKKKFDQESVLKIDTPVNASF